MFHIRLHAFGRDPKVTGIHEYLSNAKAAVCHAVRCYNLFRIATSILDTKTGTVYRLNCSDQWVEEPVKAVTVS